MARARGEPRVTPGHDTAGEVERLKREWEALGAEDPFWAVLTHPDRRGGRWNVEEFFAFGVQDIDRLMGRLADAGLGTRRERALDFGCGVGRLTQALGDHYATVDGVDVSSTMIEHARRLNRHGDRVRYHVNPSADLRAFADGSFDLVYSLMVLQHMPPEVARGYVREFVRIVRPGGAIAFQLPSAFAPTPKGIALAVLPGPVRTRLHRWLKHNPIEMHRVPRPVVEQDLAAAGARVVKVIDDASARPNYLGWFYLATR